MMFNKLFWCYEMLLIMMFWDDWDVLRWLRCCDFEMLIEMFWDMFWDDLGVVITFMMSRIHCIFEMELMLVEMAWIGKFWDEGYALLMPLLIGKFLRWEFCSNSTKCICIVLSHIIWLNNEVYLMLMNEYIYIYMM